MDILQQLTGACIIAFVTVLSSVGSYTMASNFFGTNTVTGRGRCMLIAMGAFLFTLNAMIWFGYNGFRV